MRKQILIATITYGLLSVLQPLANFILLPVYVSHFTTAEYGSFSILNNLTVFITIISGLSISQSVIAFYSSYEDDSALINKYMGNVLLFILLFNTGLLAIFLMAGNFFFGLLFSHDIPFFPNGLLVFTSALMNNFVITYFYFLKYEKRVSAYSAWFILQFILTIVLQYLFIVVFKAHITGAFMAKFLAVAICFAGVLLMKARFIFAKIDFKNSILPSLKYALNIIPSATITWIISYADRFIINHYSNLTSVGVYNFLFAVSSFIEVGFLAVGAALQPFIFDFFKTKNLAKVNYLHKLFLLLTIFIASSIILAGSNLDLFINNKDYLKMTEYLAAIAVGYIFSSMSYLFNLQVMYEKRSKFLLLSITVVLVFNLLLNIILVPLWGLWGAVFAFTVSKGIGALVRFYISNRCYPIPVERTNYILLFSFVLIILLSGLAGNYSVVSYRISSSFQFILILLIIIVTLKKELQYYYSEVKKIFKKRIYKVSEI